MERGPLLPSIQAVSSGNGSETSYKVQYAPVYSGHAKSRPLSAYEEEILKRALRNHDGDSSIIMPSEATAAAEAELTAAKAATQKLLSRRQHQAQPVILGSTNSMGSTNSASSVTVTCGNNSATLGRPRESLCQNGDYERAIGFKGIPLIESAADEFNESDLRSLKRLNSNKQKLRKVEVSGVLKHSTAVARPQAAGAAAETQPEESLKSLTLKEQAADLRRYQRRIIYMLNRVMTEAEARQFDQFIQLKGLRAKEYPLA